MHSSGGPFEMPAWNPRRMLASPASWAWVCTVLGIHAWVAMRGGPERLGRWFADFGMERAGFLTGKIWQPVSYGFLHGGWWHAALNALFLLAIGSRIEHMAGRATMVRTTAAGVLAGGLCHLLLGSGLLVGMSGACMALLLLLTTLSPQSRMFPLPVSARSLGLGVMLGELILTLVNPSLDLPGLSVVGRAMVERGMGSWFQIGHACHVGGGLAGWLYGRWILRPRVTLDRLRRERARREAE